MIVLGLTGSIGMGKSTVAKMLKIMGVPVHDSDVAVHNALSPKGDAFQEVTLTFPDAWDKKSHSIDRKKLGGIVFGDEQLRKKLENILHPIAQKSQSDFISAMQARGKRIVCLEIPLLYETGAESRVDHVIVVSAPRDMQKRRVMKRAGMTGQKFENILAAQMPDAEKCARADFVVQTGMGYVHTFRQLQKILKGLKNA